MIVKAFGLVKKVNSCLKQKGEDNTINTQISPHHMLVGMKLSSNKHIPFSPLVELVRCESVLLYK
jgi:hypothetical protein